MRRLCLCLLIALTSATVAAREVQLSSPNSGGCPDAVAHGEAEPAAGGGGTSSVAAPRTPKAKPSLHSDAPTRLGSPRWHSFLPGMFR